MNNLKKILPIIIIGILIIFLGLFVYISSFTTSGDLRQEEINNNLSQEEIREIALDFINNKMLQGQALASIVEIKEERGLYKLSLLVSGNSFNSYITKDGKLFFAEGILIDEFNPNWWMDSNGISMPENIEELPTDF